MVSVILASQPTAWKGHFVQKVGRFETDLPAAELHGDRFAGLHALRGPLRRGRPTSTSPALATVAKRTNPILARRRAPCAARYSLRSVGDDAVPGQTTPTPGSAGPPPRRLTPSESTTLHLVPSRQGPQALTGVDPFVDTPLSWRKGMYLTCRKRAPYPPEFPAADGRVGPGRPAPGGPGQGRRSRACTAQPGGWGRPRRR